MANNDSFEVLRPGRLYCWLSGWSTRPEGYYGPWHLQVAHIASGGGRARRVDDRRAVIVLCPIAHDLHVSNSDVFCERVINGVRYPTIDERHSLWLKKQFDPEYYDEDFLKTVWIGTLPTPEPPPMMWRQEFFKSTGILL
jgi:hypothetical protein